MSTRHDDLAKGEGKRLADRRVALYRDGGGNLHALSSVCPHRGCDVEWNGEEKVLGLPLPRLALHFGGSGHPRAGGAAAAARRRPGVARLIEYLFPLKDRKDVAEGT